MVLGEKHGKWTAWKVTAQDLGGTSGSQSWIILVSFSLLCLNHDLLSLYCTLGAGDSKDHRPGPASGRSSLHVPLLGRGNWGGWEKTQLCSYSPKPINMCFPWKTEIRTFTYLKAHFIHLFLHPTNNFLAAYWVPGPVPNTNYSFK